MVDSQRKVFTFSEQTWKWSFNRTEKLRKGNQELTVEDGYGLEFSTAGRPNLLVAAASRGLVPAPTGSGIEGASW
jgi:hypothetical protein